MIGKVEEGELRTPAQIKEAYEIEKELANRLRNSSKAQRGCLYSSLYDEFYKRVPLTPQLTRKLSPEETKRHVSQQMAFLRPFLQKDSIFLEVGPGDCALSLEVTKFVKQVYAVDVSKEITKAVVVPDNFQLILSDGCSVPISRNTVNVVFSDQLMEHLHPDDALEQLHNISDALAPGGVYICITPNRLSGPHDISKYFDERATGFHLRERVYILGAKENVSRSWILRGQGLCRDKGNVHQNTFPSISSLRNRSVKDTKHSQKITQSQIAVQTVVECSTGRDKMTIVLGSGLTNRSSSRILQSTIFARDNENTKT